MMKRIATLSLIFTAVVAESAGVRNYTAVTNVSFHNLTYIPSNFLDHAFGESENDYEQNVPTLPTIQRIDFHSATGLNTHAQLDYGILGFGICTNLRYAAFDSLKSGVVNLDDVTAPLVVSCSNIAKSAVVNVSDCTNLREIRFDTVPAIVNYDSRWIPQNTDWKAYVPSALLSQWRETAGWSAYADNIVKYVPMSFMWTGEPWYQEIGEGFFRAIINYDTTLQTDDSKFSLEFQGVSHEVDMHDMGTSVIAVYVESGDIYRFVFNDGNGTVVKSQWFTVP